MKVKQLLFALFAMGAMTLNSCSEGGSASSGVKKESLFGDITERYEKGILKIVANQKKAGKEKSTESALIALEKVINVFDELEVEMKPVIEGMVGKKVAYALSDSLTYRLASDIVVKDVHLPKFTLGKMSLLTELEVEFDVVMTQDDSSLQLYGYFMDDDEPIGYGRIRYLGDRAAGDTIHVNTVLTTSEAPGKYIKRCNLLKFVSESEFDAGLDAIQAQANEWEKEVAKEYGIEKF